MNAPSRPALPAHLRARHEAWLEAERHALAELMRRAVADQNMVAFFEALEAAYAAGWADAHRHLADQFAPDPP